VLCVQVLRDIARYSVHEPFFADMTAKLDAINALNLTAYAAITREAVNRAVTMLGRLQAGGDQYAQAHARRLVDLLCHIMQAALMLHEAQWEIDNGISSFKPAVTAHYVNKRLAPGYDPLDDTAYLGRLEQLMTAL